MTGEPEFITSSWDHYEDVYKASCENPNEFWSKIGKLVSWTKIWDETLSYTNDGCAKWFVGGELNACYNAVDRHVNTGRGDKTAIIYDSPLLGVSKKITYLELLKEVSKLAGVLSMLGVQKGDCVLIYMPIMPETIYAMLATVRLGAVHCVIFGGYAANELSQRIQHCQPKVIIAANCGIEPRRVVRYLDHLNDAIDMAWHKPKKCVILQREDILISSLHPERDIDWERAMANAIPHPCVSIEANEPLYVLYTSGTTGDPKGVQRPAGGHIATLLWTMNVVYGMRPDDVFWAASDFGWAVGHSYMCYAPLLYGMASVIYEGKPTSTPDPSAYYRVISQYRVNGLFTVPTVLRLLRKEDSEKLYGAEYDLSSLRHIFIAGEHCDVATKSWGEKVFQAPILNHWWQTETGHAITATCLGLQQDIQATGLSVGLPVPGYHIEIMRSDGSIANRNESGRIVIKHPMPPGTFNTLYKAHKKYLHTYFEYFPGYYDTMDVGYMDEKGRIYVTARDDDVINVAGHRLSTLAIENIIISHPEISNACVISIPDQIKNEVPFCLFVPKNDTYFNEDQIAKEIVDMVRDILGPVASFRWAAAVTNLPLTRSGKICRKFIAKLARESNVKVPGSIVDPNVNDEIIKVLKSFGLPPISTLY